MLGGPLFRVRRLSRDTLYFFRVHYYYNIIFSIHQIRRLGPVHNIIIIMYLRQPDHCFMHWVHVIYRSDRIL